MRRSFARILEQRWHPAPTDPRWLGLKRVLDVEVTERPRSIVARLARRAAVRIETYISNPASAGGLKPSLNLDTRPWFALSQDLPYTVDLFGSLDGGPWVRIAAASSGASCSAVVTDLPWPSPLGPGFHHLALAADVTFVRPPKKRQTWCAFSTVATGLLAGAPDVGRAQPLGQEERVLSGVSFARFDSVNPFIESARLVRTSLLDPALPAVPLETWLTAAVEPDPPQWASPRVTWQLEYCNGDEALWYPGDSASQQDPNSPTGRPGQERAARNERCAPSR